MIREVALARFSSDPAKDAVLHVAPDRVRMWFSETLNPAFSTAVVESGANQRVDNRDAQIAPGDASEMDVTLEPNLPPAVYIVVWRTDSNDDGHVLTGSFLFTVARLDGSVPTLSGGTIPGRNALGGSNVFTVSVADINTGAPITNVGISLYASSLDMDMGVETVNLQPDGKGHFSASGDLLMGGGWQIRIQIRTPENTLHEAIVKVLTPY